jgi:glutaryl-CoA dehydrogenase
MGRPFLLEEQLTDEERLIRDTARGYAQESAAARHHQAPTARGDRSGDLPRDGGARPARLTLPEDYGCAGAVYVAYGLVGPAEVERVDSGYRSMMSVQFSLVMYPDQGPIGDDETSGRKTCSGSLRAKGSADFGLTEPDCRLRSRRDDHPPGARDRLAGYRLTDRRPGSPTRRLADLSSVWAKSGRA